jgi:TonB family protein
MRFDNIVKLVIPSLLLVACATGEASTDHGPQSPTSLGQPTSVGLLAAGREFPAVKNPRLPSADLLSNKIREETGDVASADIRLCVAPNGHVNDIRLVRSSASNMYDRAVVKDVASWQFREGPDPADLPACEIATITYRLPL